MELPGIIIGKPRMIDRAVSVKGTNFFMVIGSAEILPVFVTLLDDDIQAVFGDPVTYYQSPLELKPEVSITPEGRLALLFTDNDFHLRLVTATVGKDFSITLTSSDEVYTFSSVYSVAYLREGVLGVGFAAGNATDVEHSIHVLCVEEEWRGENVTMRFTNTTLLTGMEEVTFLKVGAWALFDRNNAQLILAYITSDEVDGLVLLLNTVGGDIEAGLAIAELVAGMRLPTVTLVLGGGHSIGVPLAVCGKETFIAHTASMTIHLSLIHI